MNLSASPPVLPFRPAGLRSPLRAAALLLLPAMAARAQAPPGALAAFHLYCEGVEARLEQRPASPEAVPPAGEPVLERVALPPGSVPAGAMLHGWRATAFFPGATSAGLRQLLHGLPAYPRVFAPEVLSTRVLLNTPDHLEATLRVRQKHVLTVVLDTTYDIRFGQPGPAHGSMASRSQRVAEIAEAGTPGEHALGPGEEHGFLWAQNTYWTWAEQPGGLWVRVESVSLTRSIPTGLGWAVGPLVESIPRESLRFTLERTAAALAAQSAAQLERTHP